MLAIDLSELATKAAPWLAAALGIATAVAAERAFRMASDAEPPERWRGEDSYFGGSVDMDEEIDGKATRGSLRERAAALQAIATYLAAGAAIEAAAASQLSLIAEALVIIGLVVAVAPSIWRWVQAENAIAYTKAWYVRMAWSVPRKWIASSDPAVEDAEFAKAHSREARILRGQRR
ncbi:MAG TPA: hypothetical protein VGU66_17460 [Candidatus Elarobacter sp.]|nr:hypothetical protein [Candidatus Elarobacter sp.]